MTLCITPGAEPALCRSDSTGRSQDARSASSEGWDHGGFGGSDEDDVVLGRRTQAGSVSSKRLPDKRCIAYSRVEAFGEAAGADEFRMMAGQDCSGAQPRTLFAAGPTPWRAADAGVDTGGHGSLGTTALDMPYAVRRCRQWRSWRACTDEGAAVEVFQEGLQPLAASGG